MYYIFLFCLIALARISSTILSKGRNGKDPCLVEDFRGKAFNFHPEYDVSHRLVTYALYYVEVHYLYNHFIVIFLITN